MWGKVFKLIISCCLLATVSTAQNNSIIIDGAYIVLDGGTSATNIYVVVDQSNTLGIVRTINGGHISSEGQYNFVKWTSGFSTGNYVFPFGVGGTAADYIPFIFNKTTATSSNISMSTWTSNPQNVPWATVSSVSVVTNMFINNNGINLSVPSVIDRWWDIQSPAPVSAELTFSYRGIENTTVVPLDTFKAQHWNGATWDTQALPGNPGVTAGIGIVGPIPGQTTFSPWVLTRAGLNAGVTSFQNLTCSAVCTGTATVTPTGGPTPYTYSWTGGQTTPAVTGLCAGTYSVLVTDNSGTSVTVNVTITEPAVLSASVTPTDVLCNAQCNGSALLSAAGGTPGYSYLWNTVPAQSTVSASGLCASSYTCTLTDFNGCTATQTVTINQPTALTATATSTSATCGNANGTASAAGSGGSGTYTYLWNPYAAGTATTTGLSAGNYTATVTDANGCSITQTVSITNSNGPTATVTATNNICNGVCIGTADAIVSGGSQPYTYSWTNGQSTSAANNLCAGNYTVTVTDLNGCTTTQFSTITDPPAISFTVTTTPTSCSIPTGTAVASVTGGSPSYTYLWSSGDTTAQASNLTSQIYSVTVTDMNGCTQTQSGTVFTVPGPTITVTAVNTTITAGSSTQITATGGGTYLWSPVDGLSCTTCANPTATPSVTTTYCTLVTDAGGCIDSNCVTINVDIPCGAFYIPNAFSPNADGENDLECVFGNCIETMHITIYNRWGEKIFESSDQEICWDGKYKSEDENAAVFTYYLDATFADGKTIRRKGNISLLR